MAMDSHGQDFAIKVLHNEAGVERELDANRRLEHPNVLRYMGDFVDFVDIDERHCSL